MDILTVLVCWVYRSASLYLCAANWPS